MKDKEVNNEKCKTCDGDGWVYHSRSGQGGHTKSCPDCK